MSLHIDRSRADGPVDSGFAHEETTFIIGNKAFYLAVKRALEIAGGFHVVGAFRMDDIETSLRRSKSLGQVPRVAVIHEPPGERAAADDAAHRVLELYPATGIVLVAGDQLDAESERKIDVHDYNATVLPENVIRHPENLASGMHSAIKAARASRRVA